MKRWACPKCEESMETLAVSVAHRCIKNNNRMTEWVIAGNPVTPRNGKG